MVDDVAAALGIHFVTSHLAGEIARLKAAGATFRNDIVTGPGGSQILIQDPAGNLVEFFQPGAVRAW